MQQEPFRGYKQSTQKSVKAAGIRVYRTSRNRYKGIRQRG